MEDFSHAVRNLEETGAKTTQLHKVASDPNLTEDQRTVAAILAAATGEIAKEQEHQIDTEINRQADEGEKLL